MELGRRDVAELLEEPEVLVTCEMKGVPGTLGLPRKRGVAEASERKHVDTVELLEVLDPLESGGSRTGVESITCG